jgi:predicted ATPase/signal transduction histidine kinase/CheY-like chemotaxis protein
MRLAGFTVTEILSSHKDTVCARATCAKGELVMIKYHNAEQPCNATNIHWQHEFSLLQSIDASFVIAAKMLAHDNNRVIVVMEDFGAVSLGALMRQNSLNFSKRLKVACLLVKALTQVHERDFIHLNLNPDNIFVNAETMNLKLADFAKATHHKWQRSQIDTSVLWGSPAYMSPELISKAQVTVNYRSDFYSLGVVLYQLFCGLKPFVSDDFATLVQSHITRIPEPLETIDSKIPQEVSAIVQKLLAKSPDDRYHNHQGLYADLKDCQKQWQTKGQIDHFTIGQNDVSTEFFLTQRIYGRNIEQTGLIAAFDRASAGLAELILIVGKTGVGKSALVHQLHTSIVAKRGFFISGQCEQYQCNQPYAPLIEAFSGLMEQLMCEPEERLRYWRGKLKSALGKNTAVIAEIIPNVAKLTGEIPDLPELPPSETEKRFHITFGHFIKALSSSGHPLVVFIDNLQWADTATLTLLAHQTISNERNAVLLIGAYREDEVKQNHPLLSTIENIELAQGRLKSITLKNLARHHILQMICDSFNCSNSDAGLLVDSCFDKTDGNPLFIRQYLKALFENNQIRFDAKATQWVWPLEDIPEPLKTDDPVKLVTARLHKMDLETQQALSLAAHLGNHFSLSQLAMVLEQPLDKTANILAQALQYDLLMPLDENDKFSQQGDELAQSNYRFLHDIIQQAAYQLVTDNNRSALQLNIGRVILKNTPDHELDNHLYTLLESHNHGIHLITDPPEKARLLAFNIRAGIRAKSASAFAAAVRLLRIAKTLLVPEAWVLFPNQTLTVFKELAEAEYLAGNFEQAQLLCHDGYENSTNTLAKLTLILVQCEQYQLQQRNEESITILTKGLNLLDNTKWGTEQQTAEQLPHMLNEVENMLVSVDTSNVLALPEMVQLEHLLTMQLLCNLLSDLYITGRFASYGLCACQMVMLTLSQGQCDLGAIGIRAYMMVMAKNREDHQRSYELGRLAIELADHRGNKYHRSSVYQIFSGRYLHWREPLHNAFAYLQQVIKWGQEGINLAVACDAVVLLNVCKTIKGIPLPTLEKSVRKGLDFVRHVGHKDAENNVLLSTLQPILALQDKTPNPLSFDSELVSTNQIFKRDFTTSSKTLALYSYAMVRHGYLMNNRALQREFVNNLDMVTTYFPDSPLVTECNFYAALSLLGLAVPGETNYVENIKQVKAFASKIKGWAQHSPQNYEHKYLIISAELARVCGDIKSATALFDKAVEASEQAGFIQCEALANELFATFWYNENQIRVAKTFIKEAHYLYQRWGAIAKCELIEEQWPQVCFKLNDPEPHDFQSKVGHSPSDALSTALPGQLDIHALFKANQVLAKEIHLDALLKKMIAIMLENTSAQYGAIIFDEDSQLKVEVMGQFNALDGKVNSQLLSTTLAEICAETPPKLPGSLVRYVQQTQETLLIKSPADDQRFSHNEYLQQQKPESVLLLPITGQGRLLAIVYLENNLSQHRFTNLHVEKLELLASQAAVSLINASLFSSLNEKIGKRKDQLNKERDKADRANETKSLFLANMSHEIRTPLTTVIGFAEGILFGDIEKKNQHQAIQTIANSGKHLLLLINDILDFSKIEAGQLLVEKLDVNLVELLANLESISCGMVKSKPIDFSIDLALPLPDIISTDPTRLNQILLNLISNAVKFTESGSVTLKVFPQDEQLIFAVTDTGVGIKPEKIGALFFAFEQADKTVQRKYGGTGLGLTISKSLAQMLGGNIVAESQFNKGSTFTVSIDLVTIEQTKLVDSPNILAECRAALEGAKNQAVSQLEGHILVAEDQPENLQLIITMLEKMGLTVTGVRNGQEAVEAYLIDDFDLILLDIQMPIMDGLEAFDMLTSVGNDIPVIAITANAMKHEVDEYFRKGFDEHLAKPIERKPFVEKISRFLGQSADNIDASLTADEMAVLQDQFSANLPAYLDRLTEHLRTKDWRSLQSDAHALKGAAGTLGFTELSDLAAHLEQDLKDEALDPIEQEVADLIKHATTKLCSASFCDD